MSGRDERDPPNEPPKGGTPPGPRAGGDLPAGPPGGTDPPPSDAPHGLIEGIQHAVEEAREELHDVVEEVVERVPEPVRWTIRRIIGLTVLLFFGLLVLIVGSAILYVANRTEWVAREVSLVLNQTLAARSDVELAIGDLRGNPWTGVRVIRPLVRYRDGDSPPLLEAESLLLRYSAWGLLMGGSGPIEVELIKPVIQFPRGADGRIRLPTWKAVAKTAGVARRLDFRIVIRDGQVRSPALKPGIEGLEAGAFVRVGAGTVLDLERMSWRVGPYRNPLERLRARVEVADSVLIDVLELKSPELALKGRASWKAREWPRRVVARVERVRWAWLAEVFDNGTFDVPGTARIEVDASEDKGWRGSFRSALTWDELPAEATGQFSYSRGALAVTSLDARTPSGRLTGRFDMADKGWDLNARAEHADPRAWKAFDLTGWPEGDLNGTFRLTQTAAKNMDLTARLGPSTLAGWRADSAQVVFHAPSGTTDTFTVNYRRRGGTVRLLAGTRSWGWLGRYEARDFPLEEWPDGGKSGIQGVLREGHGDVVSRDGTLEVTGTLKGSRTEWLGAQFDRWTMDDVRGRLLPTPDLTARAGLDDMMFLGLHFDSTRARVRIGDARAGLDSVISFAGDTVIVLKGNSQWSPAGWNLALDSAEFSSSQFRWVAEPQVLLHGDPQGVVFDRLIARDGEARFQARGRWAAPGGHYDFDGRGVALDLARLGLPLDWRLTGRADAELRVRGPNGDPAWNFSASGTGPGQGGHAADSITLALEGRRNRLEVRRLEVMMGEGRLGASGRIERTERAWPDTLTGDGVLRWLASAGSWQGAVRTEGVTLEGLDRLLARPVGWSGRVSGDLTVGGRPADPALVAAFEVQPFGWREFRMDKLSVKATLADRRLSVAPLEMSRAGLVSTVTGTMPLRLALGEKVQIPEAPMNWQAQIPNGDLAILPGFVPQIGWSRGRFDLNATMTGTAKQPRLAGSVAVRDGAVRLAEREEVLEALSADLRFDETRLTLDSLRARQGRDGQVTGSGAIDLKGMTVSGYRFELALRDFTASESGLYAAKLNGDFVITNGRRVRGVSLPQVTGQVDVQRAVVLFDFANQSETQMLAASTRPLFWTYRVQVDARRNLHWQPPDGDLEFSADLTLEQTTDSLLIYGDLRGERGNYYFLSNRFKVVRADLNFDNENGVNPQLDIEAVARVVPLQGGAVGDLGSSSDRPHEVTARITGRAAEPQVSFTSDPPDWDEPQILRELTVGRFINKSGTPSTDPFDHYLTRAINRTVSAEMSRAFKGYINEWALEREQGGLLQGQGDLVLGVGTQLTPSLSLRYRQVLPGFGRPTTTGSDAGNLFQRQVEAEYRLSRFFYLSTELAQRRLGSASAAQTNGPDFNVNLKARWEY
ncbi:MAG: translocation/assembly module TamB domain-containing protein [Candidatus Eisenbacteria bacterium]